MTRGAYYNELDPKAAAWLRELIADGHIAAGDVDERSILDVTPDDLRGYTQCHWFAGIGGWSAALRLAGWPDDRPVWTGSCPCQPFSEAGGRAGLADKRHLWPYWHHLITQCRPRVVFGEQVEAAIRYGWLDLVRDDLEALDYAFGAAGLPAACVGAPHIRQRLWFVADSARIRSSPGARIESVRDGAFEPQRSGDIGFWDSAIRIDCRDGKRRPVEPSIFPLASGVSGRVGLLRGSGNAIVPQVAAAFIQEYLATRSVI